MIKNTAKGDTHAKTTKSHKLTKLLSRLSGAKNNDLSRSADCQPNNVRRFIADTLKRTKITVTSSRVKGKVRRYKIVSGSIQ